MKSSTSLYFRSFRKEIWGSPPPHSYDRRWGPPPSYVCSHIYAYNMTHTYVYIYIYICVCTYEVFPIITIVSKAFISGYPLIFVRVSKKSQGNSLDVYFLVGFRVISGFQRFSNDGSQEAWSTVSQLFQKETLWGCRNPKGVLWICYFPPRLKVV